jgi:shikimate kinase
MKEKVKDSLAQLRKDIDEVDDEICQLIAEREELSLQIGRIKRAAGIPLENSEREEEIFSKICARYPNQRETLNAVFSKIIERSKKLQRKSLNLYLVGMPNSGKTRVAGQLEILLRRKSADMDALIMQEEKTSIDDIFDTFGEAHFRELEHKMLIRLARQGGFIVATGGGILTHRENIPILKNSGIVIFLDRSPDRLVLAKLKNRPLIRGGAEAMIRLYNERIMDYRTNADLCVDPDSPDAAKRIADFYLSMIR